MNGTTTRLLWRLATEEGVRSRPICLRLGARRAVIRRRDLLESQLRKTRPWITEFSAGRIFSPPMVNGVQVRRR